MAGFGILSGFEDELETLTEGETESAPGPVVPMTGNPMIDAMIGDMGMGGMFSDIEKKVKELSSEFQSSIESLLTSKLDERDQRLQAQLNEIKEALAIPIVPEDKSDPAPEDKPEDKSEGGENG